MCGLKSIFSTTVPYSVGQRNPCFHNTNCRTDVSFLCCFFKKKKKILGKRFQNILRNIWENISTCLAFYSQSSNSAYNIAFFKKKKKSVFLNLFFQYSWSVGSKLIFWGFVVAKTLGLKLHWPEWKLAG